MKLNIIKEIKEVLKFKWVIYSFVSSTLKMRYKRSVLGFFWSLLGPVLNYLMVGIVFSFLARSQMDKYFVHMFAGTAIFNFFSVVTNGSGNVFIGNEHYIKKIYLPKLTFVLNLVLMELINFIFGFTALLLLGSITGYLKLSWAMLTLPLPVLFMFLFVVGLSSMLGLATVYFRDLLHVIPILTQALFFGTPILYAVDMVPQRFLFIYKLNPLYYFVDWFRTPIYTGQLPMFSTIVICVATSLIIFTLGLYLLKKFENEIIFRL